MTPKRHDGKHEHDNQHDNGAGNDATDWLAEQSGLADDSHSTLFLLFIE
jgi:hypothetical protein